jgi:hypothetical protein
MIMATCRQELLCRAVFEVLLERLATAHPDDRLHMDVDEVVGRCQAAVPDASEDEMTEACALVLAMCQATERRNEGRPLH